MTVIRTAAESGAAAGGAMSLHEMRYYQQPSALTDISRHADFVSDFPGTPAAAAEYARNAIAHVADLSRLGVDISPERLRELRARSAARVLDRVREISAAPLHTPRSAEDRMLGNCYHLAVLACALLRHVGLPCRLRYGFVPYIKPGHYEDHAVCEVELGNGWQVFDPGQGVDVGDAAAEEFVSGGEAWLRCRNGEDDPGRYGTEDPSALGGTDARGLWMIRCSLARDFAALCKLELHNWDWWGMMIVPDEQRPDTVTDELARLTTTPGMWAARTMRFATDPLVNPHGTVVGFTDDCGDDATHVSLPDSW